MVNTVSPHSPVNEKITRLANSNLSTVVEPFVVNGIVNELSTHLKTVPVRVTDIDSPIAVKPIEAQTNIDLFNKANNLNQIFYIIYEKELQGRVYRNTYMFE